MARREQYDHSPNAEQRSLAGKPDCGDAGRNVSGIPSWLIFPRRAGSSDGWPRLALAMSLLTQSVVRIV